MLRFICYLFTTQSLLKEDIYVYTQLHIYTNINVHIYSYFWFNFLEGIVIQFFRKIVVFFFLGESDLYLIDNQA